MSKIANDRLNLVWHSMHSCTHTATVGVKGLINLQINQSVRLMANLSIVSYRRLNNRTLSDDKLNTRTNKTNSWLIIKGWIRPQKRWYYWLAQGTTSVIETTLYYLRQWDNEL